MRKASCQRFGFHCRHWGLSDVAHALMHAQMRLLDEVWEADKAAGHAVGEGSESSVRDDGPRLERFLADEGYVVVPRARAT